MKKIFNFDNYIIVAKTIETNSNYNVSVLFYENEVKDSNILVGGILKEGVKDIDILKFVIDGIKQDTLKI